jgi:hypothetical protein
MEILSTAVGAAADQTGSGLDFEEQTLVVVGVKAGRGQRVFAEAVTVAVWAY